MEEEERERLALIEKEKIKLKQFLSSKYNQLGLRNSTAWTDHEDHTLWAHFSDYANSPKKWALLKKNHLPQRACYSIKHRWNSPAFKSKAVHFADSI